MTNIIAIATTNLLGFIGNDNKLLTHNPEDLKEFKRLTSGHVVIMGRKTFESIGKPLPNRQNVVITSSDKIKSSNNLFVEKSIRDALLGANILNYRSSKAIFIIGGGQIYEKTLEFCDEIILHIQNNYIQGDTRFPYVLDKFEKVSEKQFETFAQVTLKRKERD